MAAGTTVRRITPRRISESTIIPTRAPAARIQPDEEPRNSIGPTAPKPAARVTLQRLRDRGLKTDPAEPVPGAAAGDSLFKTEATPIRVGRIERSPRAPCFLRPVGGFAGVAGCAIKRGTSTVTKLTLLSRRRAIPAR